MSEHDEQVYLFNALQYEFNLDQAGRIDLKWIHAIPNGGLRNRAVAAKIKAEGAKSGVWDIFIPCPRGEWHGLYIEMKFDKNNLTQNQIEFLEYIEPNYKTAVCYTWEKAYDTIMDYLYDDPPRYPDRWIPVSE